MGQQSRRQEPVVQPRVYCEGRGLLGELGIQPKDLNADRLGPEKHSQNQEGEMLKRHKGHQGFPTTRIRYSAYEGMSG